jgi:hypothetical protein
MLIKGRSNKGEMTTSEILLIVVAILVLGVVIAILVPGIRDNLKGLDMMSQKYSGPQLNYSNTFLFTAERVTQDTGSCQVISSQDDKPFEISCPKGTKLDFSVDIKNSGSKMRDFTGGVIVCNKGDKDCCAKNVAPSGTESCLIIPGTSTTSCGAGSKLFDTVGEFEVHPVATCVKDADTGCYDIGMTKAVQSCNPEVYTLVTITG